MRISIYLFLVFPMLFWSCNSEQENAKDDSVNESNDSEEILEGGDNIYELEEIEQVEVILRVQNIYDSLGNVAAQDLYFENYDGNVLVFANIDPVNEVYVQGLYKVWLQNIDKGSIGPFVTFLDSTIEFVMEVDTTHVYDFRID